MVRIPKGQKWMLSLGLLVALSSPALAYHDPYDDSETHPLRLIAYALHPVGYTLEWLVFRPLHAVVSQPQLEPILGHRPHAYGLEYAPSTPAPAAALYPAAPEAPPPPPPSAPQAEAAPSPLEEQLEEARKAAEEAKRAAQAAQEAAARAERAAEKIGRAFGERLRK